MNLVLHIKEINKNCITRIEPEFSFEKDDNYLEGIDKVEEWKNRINIYLDPAVEPLLQNREEIEVILKGKLFKTLKVVDAKHQTRIECMVQ